MAVVAVAIIAVSGLSFFFYSVAVALATLWEATAVIAVVVAEIVCAKQIAFC